MKSKRKRVSSDGILKRKAAGERKSNPFETVVMKAKFAVLNRGPQSRQPGVLRKRAIETRKQTLGKEFAQLHKTNQFKDARVEGKQVRPSSNTSQRKEMYNLNLTHRGQTLAELENLEDAVDDDNDDDDESGALHDDFTRATHFGGGSDDEGAAAGRDRKTVIEEMIMESKRLKAEKQRDNDQVYEKSQELDKDLKLLLTQVGAHMRKESDRPAPDDYDRTMREMIFERRGTPAEKLKSEEMARTEQERRERLERERLKRMENDLSERGPDNTKRHVSADALDDGYLLDGDENNGLPEVADTFGDEANGYDPRNISQEAEGKSAEDTSEQENDSEEENDESDGSDADSLSDLKNVPAVSDEEDEESEEEQPEVVEKEPPPSPLKAPAKSSSKVPLPSIIELPKQYEDFATLLKNRSVEQQALIVEKIIQKANENNHFAKSQRPVVFVYIIQHLVDRFTVANAISIETDFRALHLLTPLLYDLAHKDPAATGDMFLDILREKYADFQQHPQRHPPLATLIILKLLPSLYSASDARHAIVTPGLVFISELLTRCPVRNRRHIARGLLLVTVVLECIEHSKRFLPAAFAFLTGVITLACPRRSPANASVKCVHPFKATAASLLPVQEGPGAPPGESFKLTAEDLIRGEMTESFKVRAVATAVSMMGTIGSQLSEFVTAQTIVKTFLHHLDALEEASFPSTIKVLLKKTRRKLNGLAAVPLPYLVQAEKKPKPLRLLEPKIQPVYDDIRRRPKTAESLREQRKKLRQKVKKVARGAAREIRLDNEFIAKLQHKRRMESDRERKDKVRRIFSDATTQQGEIKSLDRKAKYRK